MEQESEIERELAEVTFEDLQKAKSNGSLSVFKKPDQEKKGGRANKNRPTEVSCKKPVTRFREVVQVPKKVCFIFLFSVHYYSVSQSTLIRLVETAPPILYPYTT